MTPPLASVLPLVDAGLRGALVATLLLLGALLARDQRRHAAGRTGIALMAGLLVQTFATLPPVEQGWPILWQAPLVGVSIGNSVLFWLFARALFDDGFAAGPGTIALWLAVRPARRTPPSLGGEGGHSTVQASLRAAYAPKEQW